VCAGAQAEAENSLSARPVAPTAIHSMLFADEWVVAGIRVIPSVDGEKGL
jgi:hypothetical protein